MKIPLIGVSQSIERIRELIKHVANTGLNVVISGESGVGKEVVAQNLYLNSSRRGKPFVKVNCAALPEGLLESELFGYERGAFTGAERKKRGKFELAHEGVLFLDEIGDMSLPLQAKLLHVLQSGEFAPLGSEKEIKTDTWVIAATNQELEQHIKNGKFREDLYYRLNIIKIYIPPLRNRPEDIPSLLDYYIESYNSQFDTNQLAKPSNRIMEKLMAYHWPGNVRELQNLLRRMMVVGDWEEIVEELSITANPQRSSVPVKPTIESSSIVADILKLQGENSTGSASFSLKKIKKKTLDRVEKEVISYILDQTGWNRSKAAKILKISYKTLLYKITDLNIIHPMNSHDKAD
ncbi:MAG TPA: sigma-54 dependent transcriptional regulator [Desulfobacterales bacterium]|nr:sigma-54 dependent transcriptional regulator [Desulfobacterales bacterium]